MSMKIEESTVKLSASHAALRSQTTELTIESSFKQVFQAQAKVLEDKETAGRERIAQMLQSLVSAILAAVQGKKCPENIAATDALPQDSAATVQKPESGRSFEWHCKMSQTVCETEKTSICGSGRVCTQDGRAINFDFTVNLAREYKSEQVDEESGSIVLQDPLVINFAGKSSELTEAKIQFDLNADGQLEEIPCLAASSGFLVFDRNGNGQADDGSELFGASSGDGFNELAQFDLDKNGWVDENDPAFAQMAVWSGKDFSSLKERGVGALYTGAVDAPFSLKTDGNQLLGQIRSAGIYLSEAGEVGQLQQVDLAISALPVGQEQPAEGQRLAA
jgi:hypothetical protein